MNINTRQQKLIEKYLDDNLNKDQLLEFEKEIKIKAFREQLLFQARLVDSSKNIGHEKLRNEIEAFVLKRKKKPSNKITLLLLIGIIGFTICLMVGYNLFNNGSNSDSLYAQYFQAIPPEVNNRGDRNEFPIEYQKAMQLYIDKDFNAALSAFADLNVEQENISLYKAMCQIELNRNQEAKNNLEGLKTSVDNRIKQNAEWYLVLLAIKEGDASHAKLLLNKLLLDEGHLFGKQAKKLNAEL